MIEINPISATGMINTATRGFNNFLLFILRHLFLLIFIGAAAYGLYYFLRNRGYF